MLVNSAYLLPGMKTRKTFILKQRLGLIGALAALLGLVIANSIFLALKNKQSLQYPGGDEIEKYALLFLQGEKFERRGKYYDCSGFTREVFGHFKIHIARSAAGQHEQTNNLSADDLKKGNLVFFRMMGDDISHVGIYLKSNMFIHSPGRGKIVRTDSLTNTYWMKHYAGGGRINF
jgi:hypothetical protein